MKNSTPVTAEDATDGEVRSGIPRSFPPNQQSRGGEGTENRITAASVTGARARARRRRRCRRRRRHDSDSPILAQRTHNAFGRVQDEEDTAWGALDTRPYTR